MANSSALRKRGGAPKSTAPVADVDLPEEESLLVDTVKSGKALKVRLKLTGSKRRTFLSGSLPTKRADIPRVKRY